MLGPVDGQWMASVDIPVDGPVDGRVDIPETQTRPSK